MEVENILKETIEAVEMHKQLVGWVRRKKGQKAALNFAEKYKDIFRKKGLIEAIKFQNKMAEELGLVLTGPVFITTEERDGKLIITVLEKEVFEEEEVI
jgi:hypothetical protein